MLNKNCLLLPTVQGMLPTKILRIADAMLMLVCALVVEVNMRSGGVRRVMAAAASKQTDKQTPTMEAITDNFLLIIKSKDAIIEQLRQENENFSREIERLKSENEILRTNGERQPNQNHENQMNEDHASFFDIDDEFFPNRRRSKRRRGRPKRLIDSAMADEDVKSNRGRKKVQVQNIEYSEDVMQLHENMKTDNFFDVKNEDDEDEENHNEQVKIDGKTEKPLERMMKKHPHQCDWPGCERSFRRPAFLRKHKRIHTGEKPFKCDFDDCDYRTGDLFCLRTHQLRHTGEKPFKCKVSGCNWSGRQQTSLDRHRRVFHAGARPYICDWPGCDRRYRDKHSLNYHSKSHTGEKEFMCSYPECGKRFIGRSDMKKHETTHTNNKPHKCSWPGCGRSFVQKRALNVHNLKHTGERPYPCDWPGCEWRSYTPHESAKHKKTHTGERPFPCDRCERRFADESNLKAHQRVVHEGEKRHVCEVAGCGKKYTVRRTLLIHQMRSHSS